MDLNNRFVSYFAHLYHYERKVSEDGDENIEAIDTIPIKISVDLVRLQNPDSYQIKIVEDPLEDLKNRKKFFSLRSRFGINLSALDLESFSPNRILGYSSN